MDMFSAFCQKLYFNNEYSFNQKTPKEEPNNSILVSSNFKEHKQPSQLLMLWRRANGILQHEKYLYTALYSCKVCRIACVT